MKSFFLILVTVLGVSRTSFADPIAEPAQQKNLLFSEVEAKKHSFSQIKHHQYSIGESINTPIIFQNPFMAPNNFSEVHNNSYQTDTVSVKGPGSSKRQVVQAGFILPLTGIAGTIAFNSEGKIISVRTGVSSPTEDFNTLMLIDPKTLEVISELSLPPRPSSTTGVSFSGGGYFYLDNEDRVVCVTSDQSIRIYELVDDEFVLVQSYDLSIALNNPSDLLNSILPDSFGNLWFISQQAKVGYVTSNGTIYLADVRNVPGANPDETNSKSFASDENGGIFLVTNYALYRFQIGSLGMPVATWRSSYDRGTRRKPGQNQQGCGTTPTLFNDFEGNEFVAIADNADPFLHILVFNRNTGVLLAQQAVFKTLPFRNSCENSLIAVNRSIMVENNYGNVDPSSTLGPLTTEPGLARIDFDPITGESEVVWDNQKISIPSIVTALSTADGLIYTYAKDSRGWYFAAVDYRSGKIIRKDRIPGSGILVDFLGNNFYGGLNIGPNKCVYAGVFGGIVAWRPKSCR